jgi:putative ABC transport system substrate-binding protein
LALLALLAAAPAHAGGIVALTDARVPQYNEALVAARAELRGVPLPVIDPAAANGAAELKKADPAVVLAIGGRALQAVHAWAPSTPVVACLVLGGPQPSRTVTGVRFEVPAATQLEKLTQVHTRAKRVGVIYDPRASGPFIEEAFKATGRLGVTLVSRPVSEVKQVPGALAEIAESIDALWLMSDPRLMTPEMLSYILGFTLERRVALFGFLDSFTKVGALASVAPDYAESGRRAAHMALELYGKPPEARLPVPPPTVCPGALSINQRTARQLGVDIPPDVLAKARQVYR